MNDIKESLYKAVAQLLRPIIRMLLRQGISHSEFVEIAKRAYVDVAFNDFMISGKKKTVSRAAVITGLSRKEVLRFTMHENIELPRKGSINRANRVINAWLTDDEFIDASGQCRELPLVGEVASFASLVKKYSGDITAGAVLDELVRIGAVSKLENHCVRLTAQGYIPQGDQSEKVRIMGINTSDFLNTIDHNIFSDEEDLYFQRQVAYSHLPKKVIPNFRELSRYKSMELLLELNKWMADKDVKANPNAEGPGDVRAGLGIYYFEEPKK